jgi:hypothetical protein
MSEIRDQAPATSRGAETRSRSFVDGDGQIWQVSERSFSEYDRRRGFSLIFTCDLAVRRVRDYPANWFDLSDDALAALSWGV